MWGTIAKLVGGPLIKRGFDWLMGKQEERKQARALRAEWELQALKKSSTLLRIVSYLTLWTPIFHAYYLAMSTSTIEKPEDVAHAIQQVFNAFPQWWVAAALSILLAVWGLKEHSVNGVTKAVADKEKERGKAAAALQERKRDELKNPKQYHR